MTYLIRKIISMLISLVMLAVFCPFVSSEGYEAKNPDALKVNFAVLSDCHVEGNNFDTYKMFGKILADIKASKDGNDALVFLGDSTMNGQEIESIFFYGTINTICPAKQYINVLGNHDIGNGEGDYNIIRNRFIDYSKTIMGESFSEPYYYKVINGCYFIVLATEDQTVNFMNITDTQLEWFKGVLDEASEENAPVFVFNHYPADYIQDREEEVLTDIMDDYDNLLYFCGHTHYEFTEESIYELNGVNCINLPRSTEGVDYEGGIGAQVEVYEDEVIVRIRDFDSEKWLTEYERSYPIND